MVSKKVVVRIGFHPFSKKGLKFWKSRLPEIRIKKLAKIPNRKRMTINTSAVLANTSIPW
jgi:hypothetical protein